MRPVETRPSNAHRWTRCAAAPLHASRASHSGGGSSDAAREGTCAAWLAEQVLSGAIGSAWNGKGLIHPNGWPVDDEMMFHVQNYVDMISAEGGLISVERKVWLSDRVAGTLDNAASMLNGQLVVRDLKYGRRLVETDSPQLIIYAGALLREHPGATHVRTEIYQPRGFHRDGIHRGRDWTADEIKQQCVTIIEQAERCHRPNPIATPGPQCRDCEGATGCEALASTVAQTLATVETVGHRDRTPDEMASGIAFFRHALDVVKAAERAIESEATARIKSGERIPGWGLQEKTASRKVTASAAAIKALTGVDGYKSVPKTMTELAADGVSTAALDAITTRPPAGHKLAPLDAATLARQFKKD